MSEKFFFLQKTLMNNETLRCYLEVYLEMVIYDLIRLPL